MMLTSAVSRGMRRLVTRPATTVSIRGCASWEERHNPTYRSPWNKWFPYEPVPSTPKMGPYKVHVNAGEAYHFCTCGESANQPWCEGDGGPCPIEPNFTARTVFHQHNATKLMCGCKKAPGAYCNGTCATLWMDVAPVQASGAIFAVSFVVGVITTFMLAP